MAQTYTSMGTKVTANAAAVATAMTGTTTAEAQALGALLKVLGTRPDLAWPPTALVAPANAIQIKQPG